VVTVLGILCHCRHFLWPPSAVWGPKLCPGQAVLLRSPWEQGQEKGSPPSGGGGLPGQGLAVGNLFLSLCVCGAGDGT
jgi:hypothetical protein